MDRNAPQVSSTLSLRGSRVYVDWLWGLGSVEMSWSLPISGFCFLHIKPGVGDVLATKAPCVLALESVHRLTS